MTVIFYCVIVKPLGQNACCLRCYINKNDNHVRCQYEQGKKK